MSIPNNSPLYQGTSPSSKSRLLLVSFSESETAFLGRVAKILALAGGWECSFLLLHALTKDSSTVADFDAVGISHISTTERRFYDQYARSVPATAGNGFSDRVRLWCRELKTSQLAHQRMVGLLLEIALFIPWVFLCGIKYANSFSDRVHLWRLELKSSRLAHQRMVWLLLEVVLFIPWVFRSSIKYAKKGAVESLKHWLRGSHPSAYRWLRYHGLILQSIWGEIPLVSKYYLIISKKREESRLKAYIDAAGRFFSERTPDLLILAKDSAYYPTTTFVQAARNLGIPSVVIPYDRADSVTLAKDRLGHPSHVIRTHAAREVAKKFPSWVYTYENQPLLLVAPAAVHAIEQLNLAPTNPWGYNNSRCNKIFLETEEDRQLFLNSGAPTNQLVVVGAPYMDSLDETLCQRDLMRAQLCSTFGFAPNKPFVVASVSPNKVSQRSADLEFKSYQTLIDKWSSALVRHLDCNLIYSLHPLTNQADVVFIEKKGGKFLNIPLEELIAAADLYVVDCSSTARWARYVGVDVIDYDFYKYNLWFNSEIEGVCHVTDYNDFISELIKINEKLSRRQVCTVIAARQAKISFRDNLNQELNNLLIASNENPVK